MEWVNQVMEDILRACIIDFASTWELHLPLIEFAYNNSFHSSIGMASFKALYGRPCRSPLWWAEVGENQLLGPDMIQETHQKIQIVREKMKMAQTRYKSYADSHCKDREFKVGDHMLLKVSLVWGIVKFGQKRGKLSPQYIRPFEILKRVGKVVYKLALPLRMSGVHNVFHIRML